MNWTTEKPTQSGWYWVKSSSVEIVRIYIGVFDGFPVEWVWQVGMRAHTQLHQFIAVEWQGPLEPTERTEGA